MFFPTSRKPPSLARVLAALFICFAISFPIGAEAGVKEKNRALNIQLRPINAPITGMRKFTAPITVYIQAASKDDIRKICHLSPRIVDAVLQILSRHPIPVVRRKLDLSNVPAQIIAPINRALGAQIVAAVYVAPTAITKGKNNYKFKFASTNCKMIKEIEDAKKKAAAAKESQ